MKLIQRVYLIIMLVLGVTTGLNAQQNKSAWSKWDYLIGVWEGDGKGDPGEAKGWFSLKTDLEKNVLVRTNHAEFPATKDRPATVHEDLMIVYAGSDGSSAKAIYFDNEKHVINYTVSYNESESAIILTSEVTEGAPRFRFTYKKIDEKKIKTIFEVAPPGKPDAFQFISRELRTGRINS